MRPVGLFYPQLSHSIKNRKVPQFSFSICTPFCGRARAGRSESMFNWQAKFLKKDEDFMKMHSEIKGLWKENKELAVNMKELEIEKIQVTTKLLELEGLLSPRGAFEYFLSSKSGIIPDHIANKKRLGYDKKKRIIFVYRVKQKFRDNVKKIFGREPTEEEIGNWADEFFACCSDKIHTYKLERIVAGPNDYRLDHRKLLKAICETLGVESDISLDPDPFEDEKSSNGHLPTGKGNEEEQKGKNQLSDKKKKDD